MTENDGPLEAPARMTRRRGRYPAGLAAVASVCCLLACESSETERVRSITEILQTRATHVANADRRDIARGLVRAERRTGIDAFLLLAVMEEESHFRPLARSPRNALGLLQVRPATGRDVAARNSIPWKGEISLFEPSTNLLIGATYLAELRESFGSWDLALTAYNQGPTRARKIAARGTNRSSRYAARVLRRFEALRKQSTQ